MVVIRKTLICLLVVVAISACTQGQDETPPKRETFTLPVQMKALGKGLEEAGVKIIYGVNNVYWVLEVAIKAGEFDNFKELMGEMVEATQANEANTLNYEWTISQDGQSCHIYERYADSAATMTHLGAFGEKFAERFMAAVEPTRFVVYGNPNSEVKEALSGFGAVFMAPFGGFARQ